MYNYTSNPSAFYPHAPSWPCCVNSEYLPCWNLFTNGFQRDGWMEIVYHIGPKRFGQTYFFFQTGLVVLSVLWHLGDQLLSSAWDTWAYFTDEETKAQRGSPWFAVVFACFLCPSNPKASTCHTKGFLVYLLQQTNMLCLKKSFAVAHVIIWDAKEVALGFAIKDREESFHLIP